jgi:hypothetical protein
MPDRLLIGVLGNRHSGKSTTWNKLFGETVRTGVHPRRIELRPGECVEVFLVSGSPEERREYVGDILGNQNARIVLCSMQYHPHVHETLNHFIENGFRLCIQWLNPGYNDAGRYWDHLGIADQILSHWSSLSLRDATGNPEGRVQEIRESIYGWAKYRSLIAAC